MSVGIGVAISTVDAGGTLSVVVACVGGRFAVIVIVVTPGSSAAATAVVPTATKIAINIVRRVFMAVPVVSDGDKVVFLRL
jgi:hypothetical protein